VFQVAFVLQNTPQRGVELGDLKMSPVGLRGETAKFDLTLSVAERKRVLAATMEYNSDLFEAGTIGRMLKHYETILEGIVADPGQRLSQLPLLSQSERQRMLAEWNDTGKAYPDYSCMHRLFEAQAQMTPDSIAVIFGDEEISYRQLNRRANQIGRYLRGLGVGAEVIVGVCIERGIEMIVGLLGILKSGSPYLPLDPAYPTERLAFMLQDAGVFVLVTQDKLADILPAQAGWVVSLDGDRDLIAEQNDEDLVIDVLPQNLAYVIYTSGSTGQPKGVAVQHSGLVNLVCCFKEVFELTASDRTTQLAALGFDAMAIESWPYLLAGASIHVADEEKRASPAKLVEWFKEEAITISWAPTPVAELILQETWPRGVALRSLLTGGDKLQRRRNPEHGYKLVNIYGPTEDTVCTTWTEVPGEGEGGRPPAIGRPIWNTLAYIVDVNRQEVPVGVAGEMYIGGAGVARGYLNRPDLTAERFIPDWMSGESGKRLYRTGDRVRYGPDGDIEFLGRIDQQMKVRGFRIEPGEIEAALIEHPCVKEAAVVTRQDDRGDKRIVAYVVSNQGQSTTHEELRGFLKLRLPSYMAPGEFVTIDALPLTSNGKVDRKALPAPRGARPDLERSLAAPRNPVEQEVAGIWAEVLGSEHFGIDDDFFDLGGHSLLVAQLLSRLNMVFKVELEMKTLFAVSTVAGQAEALVKHEARPTQVVEIARLRRKIRGMSSEEVKAVLHDKKLASG